MFQRLLAVLMLLSLILASATPAQDLKPASSPEPPLPDGKQKHPCLLVRETDFTLLKTRLAKHPHLKSQYERLRQEAQEMLLTTPCRYELHGGEGLLSVSRTVLRRVYLLSLVYRVEGGSRWLGRLWQELAQAAQFPDWHPSHFLDTAEMTHAFAIAYDWLYQSWTEEQRRVLRQALVEKGLQPGLAAYREGEKSAWWVSSKSNWNIVCNSGLGLGALAVRDEEPALAERIMTGVRRSLPPALAAFSPDGGYAEGPLYWSYATYYLTLFLAAQDTMGVDNGGLTALPGMAETGFFPLYLMSPLGRLFNFADAPEYLPWRAQLAWLAGKFRQPVFAWPGIKARQPHPLELLWWTDQGSDPSTAELPLDRYFRGMEVATFRSSWHDPQGIFVGFKGGDNRAPHAHLDLGTFVLDALGHRWVLDLGPDNYDLPGYFGKTRFDYYRLRAEGHNTLVLKPGPHPDQVPHSTAPITHFSSSPERSLAVADLTAAYAPHARRVIRGVALLHRRQVLVQDEILAASPLEVLWCLHTPARLELAAGGRRALLHQGQARLQVDLLSPREASFAVQAARPLPLSPHPPGQNPNQGVQKLVITLPRQQEVLLAVSLTPLTPGAPDLPPPALTPLEEW